MSPPRPAYQQHGVLPGVHSLRQATFTIDESPAMGLLRPAPSQAATHAGMHCTDLALESNLSANSLPHSSSSTHAKPAVLQENHQLPTDEATLLLIAPKLARSAAYQSAAALPVEASPATMQSVPVARDRHAHNDFAALSEQPSLRSPFVAPPSPCIAAFTPTAVAPAPKCGTTSSFIQNLKLSEANKVIFSVLQLPV